MTATFSWAAAALVAVTTGDPVCRNVTTQLDTIMASPAFEDAHVGLVVRRLDDGVTMYAHNADQLLIPASNIKLVSTAAALHYLGTDFRFTTEVLGDMDDNGHVDGDIHLRGNGDPWLVPERVWYLANRLYYSGLRSVSGSIIVDDSYFGGDRQALGHEQDESSHAYMARRGAVSVGFNTLLVHVYPGSKPGARAEILVEPRSEYARIDNQTTTVTKRSHLTVDVVPEKDRSAVVVSGQVSVRDSGRGYYRRVDNPPVFAGEVLKQALKEVGVRVRQGVKLGIVPEDSKRIAQLASPRLSEIVTRVNKHSNNFMSEQIALATGARVYGAPGTWDKAKKAIETFLAGNVGINAGSYALHNASGLHDVNRVTPRQLVRVLDFMYGEPRLRPEYMASMPVAGTSGTLSGRMRETSASGLLRAKTGTLSIASALSGYVTARRGETLAFSLLVNDYRTTIDDIWAAQDEVGAAMAGFDSRCLSPNARSTPPTTAELKRP